MLTTVTTVTDVTIRDVDDETYDEFSAEARRQGKSIGTLATEAMRAYIRAQKTSESEHTISGLEELSVSKKDLEEGGIRVDFFEIGKLIFEDDVDIDTFEKFVESIFECDEVDLPGQLPKMRALIKCRECKVHFRKHDML